MAEQGTRHNQGKPDYTLIDYHSLQPLVRVLEHGVIEYGRNNWRGGFTKESLLASLQRHVGELIDAMNCGTDETDPKTQQHLIGHIMANAMFYSNQYVVNKTNKEDGKT